MADALRTRRRTSEAPEREASSRNTASQPRKRTQRKRVGKRSDPDYMLASAFVRTEVYEKVRQALLDPEVKKQTLSDLEDLRVKHQPGKPLYSDVVEMLLKEWLDRSGWSVD